MLFPLQNIHFSNLLKTASQEASGCQLDLWQIVKTFTHVTHHGYLDNRFLMKFTSPPFKNIVNILP